MNVAELLDTQRIAVQCHFKSKKRVLEQAASLCSQADQEDPPIDADRLFRSFNARERLGSTGLGKGIAIPHGRLADLKHPHAAFLQLAEAVDYEALDEQPVDLVFALAIPEDSTSEHLNILSALAERLSDEQFCQDLRQADSPQRVLELFRNWQP